jgi:predicted Rossmann fold nucleotide-binding protein DprA/Smf involved in DNA uptake
MKTSPAPITLDPAAPTCPPVLSRAAEAVGATSLHAIGALDILARPLLGYFCSSRCPGSVILRAYDLARELREMGIPVVSGFHASIERECLRLLLRGGQPIVVCAARSLARMRVPAEWRQPIAEGRLLILSPITGNDHRPTAEHAAVRNQFAAALASAVLVAHAAPGSKVERLCAAVIERRQPLLTLDDPVNGELIARGARAVSAATIGAWWAGQAGG